MVNMTRWGILATGGIAAKFTSDLALVPDAEVVAVASRTEGPADRFAAEHGIGRAHASWQALAEDPDVDVVYVATPHIAHHAAAKAMLRAGKPVLCEKPFTVTGAQARDLVDTARAAGVFLAEAMWMRTNPAVRRAAALVASGDIGEVRSIHAEFGVKAPVDPGHRLRDPRLGGGALLDLGVYPVTLAQLILGTPARVQSTARLTGEGVDETTGILLDYPSGAHAAISCSIATFGPVSATITGDRGFIELPYPFYRTKQLIIYRDRPGTDRDARDNRDPVVEDHPYDGNGLRFQAIEVGRCLAEGLVESPMFPHADTVAVMATMDRVREQIGVVYPGE
jgi:predicted dehydrogenase